MDEDDLFACFDDDAPQSKKKFVKSEEKAEIR